MALITPSQLTFSGQEVRTFAETVLAAIFEKPEFSAVHTLIPNIVTDTQIAILGRMSKITKKDAGCGTGANSKGITMSEKTWTPVQTKIWLQECHTQFEGIFMVYMKQRGKNYADFSTGDIADFIIDLATDAAVTDAFRIAWFNDTAHTVVGAGSGSQVLTAGTSLTDYTIINGLWKQIFAIAAATPARRVTISENAAASFVLQDTWAAAPATPVSDYLSAMINKADPRLKGSQNKVFLATTSILDQYANELESQKIDASYTRIEGGYSSLKRRGIDLIGMPTWDSTIREDFSNGTKYNLPHRILLTTKENIQIGMDDTNAVGDFKIFYDEMTETVNVKGGYKVDAKIIEDYMIEVAY